MNPPFPGRSSTTPDAGLPATSESSAVPSGPGGPVDGEGWHLDTTIVGVTVYPDQARITRRGQIVLPPGRHQVYVEPLPFTVLAETLRVGGHGPATVLGVDVVRRTHRRAPDANVDELRERRQLLVDELADLTDAEKIQQEQLSFLSRLGARSSVSYAGALARGTSDAEAALAVAEALAARSTEIHAALRRLAGRRRDIDDEVAAIDRQVAQLGAAVLPDRLAAVIDIDVTGNADERAPVRLELSYLVPGAGWSSTYDVRVEAERMTLTWYALVTQQTGEHWPECDLVLSTARPSHTAAVPELSPWYLFTHVPPPPRMTRRRGGDMSGFPVPMVAPAPSEAGMDDAAFAAPQPAAAPIEERTATVEQGVTAATYRSTRPVAVPSDGGTHRATVAVLDLTGELDYVTAPVLAAEAQLRASVVNSSEHTLLPGPAAVFSGADFVGGTRLETWAPGERVELALGVDDRIRVERKMVGRWASKAKLGSTRHREVEYRITVTNHTPRAAAISVLDQLPVSRDHNVVVREVRVSPEPAERTDLGVLTWKYALDPGASAEATLRLRVDVAGGLDLAGWRE